MMRHLLLVVALACLSSFVVGQDGIRGGSRSEGESDAMLVNTDEHNERSLIGIMDELKDLKAQVKAEKEEIEKMQNDSLGRSSGQGKAMLLRILVKLRSSITETFSNTFLIMQSCINRSRSHG